MKLSVLAGLGTVRGGYHQLMDSYMESRGALGIAEMNDWNRVYPYAESAHADFDLSASLEEVRQLHDAIFQKHWQQASMLWSRISKELSGCGISLLVCKGVCSGIASSLWTAALPADSQSEYAGPGLDDLLLKLNRCGSNRAMLACMDDFVASLTAQIQEDQAGKKSHALVERVIKEYIEKCYHENISLEQIAASLHVNRNYLSQLFKRVTGEPFVTYVNKFRIRKAIDLIRTGKYMVYEISERVGFQNSTYFSQVFKSITGCSPSEYNR